MRILELDAEHPVVRKPTGLADDTRFADGAVRLYHRAMPAEGALPADSAAFGGQLMDGTIMIAAGT